MRSLLAFTNKEWMEQLRSGRFPVLCILFIFLGVMNPGVAKLTPWLLTIMADSLAGSGVTVTSVTVSAMDSWMQFFKNAPLSLIAFLLLQSSIFTREYQSGALMLVFTKGFPRFQAVIAKASLLLALWSAGYWLMFGITYIYTAYFWENSVACNLALAAACWWIFGLWVIALYVLFSVLARSNGAALAGTCSTVLIFFLIGLFPRCREYVPTFLTDGASLIYGLQPGQTCFAPMAITVLLSAICLAASIPLFGRREL